MRSRCQNCYWAGPDEQLGEIKHLTERVSPGEPMPSGECPACGALCQPITDECQRCNSPLDRHGFCIDLTCPYSDRPQHAIWSEE